jgi:hypothetical protein
MLSLVIAPADGTLPHQPDPSQLDVNIWRSTEGQLCAFAQSSGEQYWLYWPGVAVFAFTANSEIVTAVPYLPIRRDLIQTTFHHSVLPLILQALGREGVHASAVRTPRGVVGFCGKTYTGKSTLAYAMSKRGFSLWSDDALVWEQDGKDFRAVRLPFRPKLRPSALRFFGRASLAEMPDLGVESGDQTAPLAAICVLTRKAAASDEAAIAIERMSGGNALATLLDHAHCFNPYNAERKRRMLARYLSLLASVPVFEVRFEPSLPRIFELVDTIVQIVVEG